MIQDRRVAHRRSASGLILAMVLALCPQTGEAQPLERLTIGIGAVGASEGGLLMAKEAGFFKDQGLDVDFVFFPSDVLAMQTLVSGHLSVISGGGAALINAVLAGAEVTAIGELIGTLPYVLVVLPEIATPADLKGKRLGINRYGATADFALRFALTRLGLDPRRDVTILQIGETSVRLAALQARNIDGSLITPPSTIVARKLGFRELTDMERVGLRYPGALVVASKTLIQKRPETLRRLLTGIVLGTHAFKTRQGEAIRVLGKYLRSNDNEALAETHAANSKLLPQKPFVGPEGLQVVLDEVSKDNPRGKTAKPDDFIDLRFVRELDESGFIDRLYKR